MCLTSSRLCKDDAQLNKAVVARDFQLKGLLQKFDAKFFYNVVPVVGDGLAVNVCWQATVIDPTGSVAVKVWDKAFRTATSAMAGRLRSNVLNLPGVDGRGARPLPGRHRKRLSRPD